MQTFITPTSSNATIMEFARATHRTDWPAWLHAAPIGSERDHHGRLIGVGRLWVEDGTEEGRQVGEIAVAE